MPGPQIDRTSSIHLTDTFSSESGVSMAKAIRMTWLFEYESGRRRCPRRQLTTHPDSQSQAGAHLVLFLSPASLQPSGPRVVVL